MALKDDPVEFTGGSLVAPVVESDEEDEPVWVKEIHRVDKDDHVNNGKQRELLYMLTYW